MGIVARCSFKLPLKLIHKCVRQYSNVSEGYLKREFENFISNHFYHLRAIEAVGYQKSDIDKFEEEEKIPFSETFSGNCCWKFIPYRDKSKIGRHTYSPLVFSKGYDTLRKYTENELLESDEMVAISALKRFLREKEKHERSLAFLQQEGRNLTETKVASLLANHLLAQLLPYPSNYYLDKMSRGKTDGCPCGCGELIQFGLTQIGSPRLFFGQADIVLFPTNRNMFFEEDNSMSSIFSIKRSIEENTGHFLMAEDYSCEDEENLSAAECKKSFISKNDINQIYKQAISLSICKHKKRNLNHDGTSSPISMIPICAVTKDTYDVVMYDAENDYLLKMAEGGLEIFESDNTLKFSAVLDLWLIIYHHLFCSVPTPEVLMDIRGTCGLIPRLGEDRFASIVKTSQWLSLLFWHEKAKYSPVTLPDSKPAGGRKTGTFMRNNQKRENNAG